MRRAMWLTVVAFVLTTLFRPGTAFASEPGVPSPVSALRRTLEAAGGMDALRRLGVIKLAVDREEVTTDGKHHQRKLVYYCELPGPVPGRLEDLSAQVVAGDDGNGGWAQVRGNPDRRPGTQVMVRRILNTALFPMLLPFSLTWEGVSIGKVTPSQLAGRKTWLLEVSVPRTFFHTPQISTEWKVFVDAATFEVVRAESPYVDLGHGITADGMRFSWPKIQDFHGVQLPAIVSIIGLDEANQEKPHTRIDRITIARASPQEAAKLFANPSPQSPPQLPVLQPPPGAGKGRG